MPVVGKKPARAHSDLRVSNLFSCKYFGSIWRILVNPNLNSRLPLLYPFHRSNVCISYHIRPEKVDKFCQQESCYDEKQKGPGTIFWERFYFESGKNPNQLYLSSSNKNWNQVQILNNSPEAMNVAPFRVRLVDETLSL